MLKDILLFFFFLEKVLFLLYAMLVIGRQSWHSTNHTVRSLGISTRPSIPLSLSPSPNATRLAFIAQDKVMIFQTTNWLFIISVAAQLYNGHRLLARCWQTADDAQVGVRAAVDRPTGNDVGSVVETGPVGGVHCDERNSIRHVESFHGDRRNWCKEVVERLHNES